MFITDIPRAAEANQMLGQDGARPRPPGRMRSGTRSGFWDLKATKKWATMTVIYLCGNGTPAWAVGRQVIAIDNVKGGRGKSKHDGTKPL